MRVVGSRRWWGGEDADVMKRRNEGEKRGSKFRKAMSTKLSTAAIDSFLSLPFL
jgi:hypothetical protein